MMITARARQKISPAAQIGLHMASCAQITIYTPSLIHGQSSTPDFFGVANNAIHIISIKMGSEYFRIIENPGQMLRKPLISVHSDNLAYHSRLLHKLVKAF
jgi:hypothetical protein